MNKPLFVFLTLMFLNVSVAFAQRDPYAALKQEVSESVNDSVDIANHFYNFDEYARMFTYSIDDYESFDVESLHYPKVDMTQKTDTTPIFLQHYEHPCEGRVTSVFGPRGRRYHYGTDVKVYTGDPIYATFDGIVRIAKRSPSYGYIVILRHSNGLETYYAHLSKMNVRPDDVVKAGELIGLGGNTGRSRGSHLHFEVRYLGNPIDPQKIINFEAKSLISDTLLLCKEHFNYIKDNRFHTVKRGETLTGIAQKYQVSVNNICKINKISNRASIKAGQVLRIR